MLLASIVAAFTTASIPAPAIQDVESRQGSRLYRALQERAAIIARTPALRAGISPQQWVQQSTVIPGQSLSIAARTGTTLPFNAFCGTAGGGVFQTGPTAWFPVDPYLGTLSVGDITFDPATDHTMYACTGQGYSDAAFGSTNYAPMPGAGIYVSRDAGSTWDVIPSTINWEIVHQLRVSPANSGTMLAATPYGLFRTSNGGVSWVLKLPGYFCSAVFNLNNGTRAAAEFA